MKKKKSLNKFLEKDNDIIKNKVIEKNIIENEIDEDKSKYILEPCDIPNFINTDILTKYVRTDINNNKEYYDDLDITYKISNPKKAEWMLYKSINDSKLVGNGNTNVDIMINDNIGIDVCVLTLNNKYTNEKSILQNFSTGNDLDTLFNNKNGLEAVNIFKKKFIEKCKNKNKDIKIYYVVFICHKKNIYITSLKLNIDNINNMEFNCFTRSCKNINISNFIDDKYGNVKLYKSKKRLELRLDKKIINNTKCSKKIY